MAWLGAIVAVVLIILVLSEAFAAMLLPRRIQHVVFIRVFYRLSWALWRKVASWLPLGRTRNGVLGIFGPLSLLTLISCWAIGLMVGFALLHWSLRTPITVNRQSFGVYMYFSGVTFFTLGYGDVVATGTFGRALSVVETGLGFGFLAMVISYLPVLYQAFSRREITISLLDARAGSPPTAAEFLRRLAAGHGTAGAGPFLVEWERWSAELLESQISYPMLGFYRSQHENQSWVGALTAILDTSALLIAGVEGPDSYQARLTFAMARHAAVDLALMFRSPPLPPESDRLSEADLTRLWASLQEAGVTVRAAPAAAKALNELRILYEPFVNALAARFLFTLPPFQPVKPPIDNWQTSAWTQRSPGLRRLATPEKEPDHFD